MAISAHLANGFEPVVDHVLRQTPEVTIIGYADPRFDQVVQTFLDNFVHRGEVGASLCILSGRETLVDIYAGTAIDGTTPWTRGTVSVVHSCTKAAVALCLLKLIDEGKVDLHREVRRYWPQYAQNGKEATSVRMLLDHSAGLPALRQKVEPGAFLDWDRMVDLLAAEPPFWSPGSRHGYQMTTFGWLVGEVVRQVSGMSLGQYFKTHFANPLNLDFWIGMPDEEMDRVTPLRGAKPVRGEAVPAFTKGLLADPNGIPALAFFNTGKFRADEPASYRAEFGAGGGLTHGRGLARLFAPLAVGGALGERTYFSKPAIEQMSKTWVAGADQTLCMPSRFGLGLMKSMDNTHRPSGGFESCVIGHTAFGHAGAGGSLGFADPTFGFSFGYTMNQMGPGILLNDRGQALVDATYGVFGATRTKAGDYRA